MRRLLGRLRREMLRCWWKCLQVTSLMVSEDDRVETSRMFTVLDTTDAEGNNSG
jgi:hypothetical protein